MGLGSEVISFRGNAEFDVWRLNLDGGGWSTLVEAGDSGGEVMAAVEEKLGEACMATILYDREREALLESRNNGEW